MKKEKIFNTDSIRSSISTKFFKAASVTLFCMTASFASVSYAANIDYSGTFRITHTPGLSGINVGDSYGFRFSLNHSDLYSTNFGLGSYPVLPSGTVSNFSLWLDRSSTSSGWDPAGKSFQSTGLAIFDNITDLGSAVRRDLVSISAHNHSYANSMLFPPLDGRYLIERVYFSFRDFSLKEVVRKATVGQQISDQFVNGFFNPDLFGDKTVFLTFSSGSQYDKRVYGQFNDIRADVTTVPEPGSLALLIPAALGLFGFTRRNKAK